MYKQVLILRKDLNMRKGKMIAQGAHASLAALKAAGLLTPDAKDQASKENALVWLSTDQKKIAVSVDSLEELESIYEKAKAAGIPTAIITDLGLTEFQGVPTKTAAAVGPAETAIVDQITGHLKLL